MSLRFQMRQELQHQWCIELFELQCRGPDLKMLGCKLYEQTQRQCVGLSSEFAGAAFDRKPPDTYPVRIV